MPKITQQNNKPAVKKPGVMGRVKPLEHMEIGGIKCNTYGRSATGKTTFAATFPKKILWIVCGGSKKPGELRSIDTPEYRKAIDQVAIENTDEIREITDYLTAHPDEYKSVIVDHLTAIQDMNLREILGIEELPPQLSWGLATQSQYGQLGLQMKEKMRALLNLPQHVNLLAQERDFNSEGENEMLAPWIASALSPSTVGWLNPNVDYIFQTFIRQKMGVGKVAGKDTPKKLKDQVEYCLRTGAHSTYTTKFRVPRGHSLPNVIIDPTFDKIMQVIKGEKLG